MRHVVSAYVSNSRCGSTTEAYLGEVGTVIIAVSQYLLEASERLGAVVTVLRPCTENSTLNSHVPAVDAATPPARHVKPQVGKLKFYSNDICFQERRSRRACSDSITRHYRSAFSERGNIFTQILKTYQQRTQVPLCRNRGSSRGLVSDPHPLTVLPRVNACSSKQCHQTTHFDNKITTSQKH
jgi:hypothetical protein